MVGNIHTIHFLDTAQTAPGIFDSLFGGLFLVKGLPLVGQLLWILGISGACCAAYVENALNDPRWGRLSRFCSWASLITVFLFLLQPWDEVFINLRHSLHFSENGFFSFNRHQAAEGTVDWLVYWVLGWLHSWGVPLVEAAFVQGLLGGIACVLLGRSLWMQWTRASSLSIPTALFCFYPPLAFNCAHGFASTWFAAAILAAIRFLFFSRQQIPGWIALALIPLIRVEGAFFSLLIGTAFLYSFSSNRKRDAGFLFLSALPFLVLETWRLQTFGSLIPVPILYKATGTNAFYLAVGIRNLFADLIACGTLIALCFLAIALLLKKRQFVPDQRKVFQVLGLLACSCLPYYLSGGDWFPSYWGRYLLPFSFFTFIVATAFASQFPWKTHLPLAGLFALLLGTQVLWPISSYWKFTDHLFGHRRTLAKIHEPTIGRGHYRVQHLSQLGLHLGKTTEPSDVIASSEIATIMFFANRETLDLLGVSNPEIAKSPVRPAPSLLREFPQISELPHLIFKRLRPDLVPKHRPEYVYTFDFMWRDLMPDLQIEELSEPLLFQALDRWEVKLGGLMDVLYGGVHRLLELGYEPVVVRYSNRFMSLYFVRSDKLPEHLATLHRQGFSESTWHRPQPLYKKQKF